MAGKVLYKIVFLNHGKVYELYARRVASAGLYGFIEIGDLVFSQDNQLVVDPVEEKIREEFADVEVLHLPFHSVLRVEQVKRRGQCAIRDHESGEKFVSNIARFPGPGPHRN